MGARTEWHNANDTHSKRGHLSNIRKHRHTCTRGGGRLLSVFGSLSHTLPLVPRSLTLQESEGVKS